MTTHGVKRRLKDTREALGLSPSEIADKLGIGRNAWSQFESPKSKRKITLEASVKLHDAFRIPLDWIYCGDASSLPQALLQKLKIAA